MPGGPSSPDISAAPPPAELAPTGPQAPTPDAGSNPADTVAREAMVGRVESVLGGPPADASPSEATDALAAAARVAPESVRPSTDAAAAKGPETTTTTGEPGADGAEPPQPTAPTAEEQVAALAKAIVDAQQAAKTTENAEPSYQEKVIDLSRNEVLAERGLALAIKAGDTELQTQFEQALAAIRDERRMLMLRDKRPPEEKIKEAKEYRKQAQISRDEARKGGNKGDIDATQARLDGTDRYIQVLESEKKKTLKQLFTQLLKALGLTGMFLGGQAKEQAEAGASASGTSTGQGR